MAETSLYERLGGAFAIAAVVDRFSDALIDNPVVGKDSENPALREWHTNNLARLPGLKFMRTLWVCVPILGTVKRRRLSIAVHEEAISAQVDPPRSRDDRAKIGASPEVSSAFRSFAPAFESGRDQPMIGAPGSVARGSGGFMTNRSGERPGGQRVDLCPLSQPAQRGTRGATSAQIDGLASGTTDDISAQINSLVDWGGDRPPLIFARGQPASGSGPIANRSSEKIATAFRQARMRVLRACDPRANRPSSNGFQPARTLSTTA